MTAGACIRKTDLQEDVNITGIFPGLKASEAGKVAGEEGRGRGGGRRGSGLRMCGFGSESSPNSHFSSQSPRKSLHVLALHCCHHRASLWKTKSSKTVYLEIYGAQ